MNTMPHTFTRRPCVIGGEVAPDDWSILFDGVLVGRVRMEANAPAWIDDRWQWATILVPAQSGRSPSLGAALSAIKASVLQHVAEQGQIILAGENRAAQS